MTACADLARADACARCPVLHAFNTSLRSVDGRAGLAQEPRRRAFMGLRARWSKSPVVKGGDMAFQGGGLI